MLYGVVFLITFILLLLSKDKDGNLANKAIYFLAAVALVLIQAVIFGNMAVLKRSVHTLGLISANISLIVLVLFSVMFCYSASAITAFR
jgi:hypothetical protein